MQQTVDANVTKDQAVDADLETTLVSGLSYFSYAVATTAGAQAVADVDATTTIAYGLSSCYSSVAALETTEVVAVADATICAAN